MSCVRDICRICLQEVDYSDLEQLDVGKLGRLIKKSLLPKWHLEFFANHVICNTCIDNFRTLRNLYKLAWSSNGQIMRHKRTMKSQSIDLKELRQHNKLQSKLEHFLLCRLCFEPTKKAAVYLFDSPHNIVPLEYVNCMIKHVHLYLTMLERTVRPILCFKCWQRIQVAFAFRKHIEIISDKVLHYQKLLEKSYLDREDLQDVFYMLDKLGSHPSVDSESSTSEEDFPIEQNTSLGYIFFEEHNYFRKDSDSFGLSMPILRNETCEKAPALVADMPILTPNIDAKAKEFKDCKVPTMTLRSRNKPAPLVSVNKDKILINNKKVVSKTKINKRTHKNLVNGLGVEVSSLPKNKQKLVSILKSKMERQQQENSTWSDTIEINDEILRPRTRLSAKKELSLESPSQDLLVLRKEEIIKKKPLRNAHKPLNPQHTSTPKIKENSRKQSTRSKQSPTKQSSNTEYTFERLNFDNEVQNDKNTIEEVEVQIKKEVISDSDDDFTENGNEIMEVDDDDEPCPNLDAFIKTEPEEIMDVNDDDIDEPPELEFQGPCSYDPHFTISNTFTVNDKRHTNTLEDKRDLINSLGSEKPANLPSQNGSLKAVNDKSCLVKVKGDAKLGEKPIFKEVVINLVKCPLEKEQIPKANMANSHKKGIGIKPKPEAPAFKQIHMIHYIPTSHRKSLPERDSKASIVVPRKTEIKRKSEASSLPKAADAKPQIPIQAVASFKDTNSPKCAELLREKTTLAPIKRLANSEEPSKSSFTANDSPRSILETHLKKNKKNDKSHWDLSLINEYNAVDHTVSRKDPFNCKLCDFKTISKLGAKCHLTLHSTESASFHFCNLCSYHTTNKHNLKIHCSRTHSRNRIPRLDCGYCHSANAKLKCLDCKQFFHPKCALEDQSVKEWKCLHSNITGCVQILRNKAVILSREDLAIECDYCKRLVRNWVNCKACRKFFHYKCFYESRYHGGECPHLFQGVSPAAEPKRNVPKVDDKTAERKRNCDFCGDVLDSVIPCPACFKFMHNACFRKDSNLMKFNCRHKDIVGEVSVAKCAYCQKSTEHNALTCNLCNRILHRYCFVVDRIKKTFNCQHTADIVLTATKTKPPLPEAEEFRSRNALTASVSQPVPSTSREMKQDLMDLTDFIMLCD